MSSLILNLEERIKDIVNTVIHQPSIIDIRYGLVKKRKTFKTNIVLRSVQDYIKVTVRVGEYEKDIRFFTNAPDTIKRILTNYNF